MSSRLSAVPETAGPQPSRRREVAVDYGFVLVVLDTRSGRVRAMRDHQRIAWLQDGVPVRADPPPLATTTVENLARLPHDPDASVGMRSAARIALGRAYLAGRIAFCESLRLIRGTHRAAFGFAARDEAAQLVATVRSVGQLAPFRVRAMDVAVATLLLLRARRRTACFRLGTTADPVRTHAWLELDGLPVQEPDWVSRYTPFPSARGAELGSGRAIS